MARHEYDRRIHDIGGAGDRQEYANRSGLGVINRSNVDAAKQPGEVSLTPSIVTPHLGNDIGARSQTHSRLTGGGKKGHDRSIIAVHSDQRAGVKHQRTHVVGSGRGVRRWRASSSSSSVKAPCSASHCSRNCPNASRRSASSAASASHPDSPRPDRSADSRTARPSSWSNDTLSLSTLITQPYRTVSYWGRKPCDTTKHPTVSPGGGVGRGGMWRPGRRRRG
jgi:hypothetical protein